LETKLYGCDPAEERRPPVGRKYAVFVCYAREDCEVAEEVATALRAARFDVFFDRMGLEPAGEFQARIYRQVRGAAAFVAPLSPSFVEDGRYAAAELDLARQKWPDPSGRVFPVVVRAVDRERLPGYLRAVVKLDPPGPIAAAVVHAITRRREAERRGGE